MCPESRYWKFAMHSALWLTFVVNHIEADDSLQENMQLGMRLWILRHLEQRLKDVCQILAHTPRWIAATYFL